MHKDKIMHINVFDGDYGIKYIRYKDMEKMLKRIKEVHDKIEDDLKIEIERLTAESTKWESKFYDEAKKVDKAIEFMNCTFNISSVKEMYEIMNKLEEILQGSK